MIYLFLANYRLKISEELDFLQGMYDRLLLNNDTLLFNDYGVGHKNDPDKPDVKEITVSDKHKQMSLKKKGREFLFTFTKLLFEQYKGERIFKYLDIGGGFGLSASTIARVSEDIEVLSLEGCISMARYSRILHEDNNSKNIIVQSGHFSETIPNLSTKYDLVFIDGHNDPGAFEEYFNTIVLNSLKPGGVIIAKNIHWVKKGKENDKTLFDSWELLEKKYSVEFDFFDLKKFPQTEVEFGIVQRK